MQKYMIFLLLLEKVDKAQWEKLKFSERKARGNRPKGDPVKRGRTGQEKTQARRWQARMRPSEEAGEAGQKEVKLWSDRPRGLAVNFRDGGARCSGKASDNLSFYLRCR